MQQLEREDPSPLVQVRVDARDPGAARILARSLAPHFRRHQGMGGSIVALCIGTDRSTGDALGPLVGTTLSEARSGIKVQGTLDEPVHAGNLTQVLKGLSGEDALILAVDACLGQVSQVGTIALGLGPVRPGAGVNKVLPEVGQLHITGTVNVGGFMEYLVLQNTRLSLVIKMARVIAEAIRTADQMAAILDETEALRRLSVD